MKASGTITKTVEKVIVSDIINYNKRTKEATINYTTIGDGFSEPNSVILTPEETAQRGEDDSILVDKVFEVTGFEKVETDTSDKIIGISASPIKGSLANIYYKPSDEQYSKIVFDEDEGNVLFDSEEIAEAKGYAWANKEKEEAVVEKK